MAGTAYLMYSTCDRYDSEAREYTSRYKIIGHDRTEHAATAIVSSGVPALGSAYSSGAESDSGCIATSYANVQPMNWEQSREVWMCDVKYSSLTPDQARPSSSSTIDNPILKPPIISFAGHRRRRVAYDIRSVDDTGRNILNTVGDRFPDSEVQVDSSSLLLRITKNYAAVDFDIISEYTDSVNWSPWMQLPARCWKMDPPSGRKLYWGNTVYWEISYQFQSNDETWDLQPVNSGTLDKNGDFFSDNFTTVIEERPLTVAGEWQRAAGLPLVRFDGSDPTLKPFQFYLEKSFTVLGLPSDP